MAEASWEKPQAPQATTAVRTPNRAKFAVVGLVLLAGLALMLLSGTAAGGRFFMTVNDLASRSDLGDKTIRITGAVIGETIKFDTEKKLITFTIAHVTDDTKELEQVGGLGNALHLAVSNPTAKRIQVQVSGQAMPDLLKNEAQAIVTGKLGADGIFRAEGPDSLLLKCPSKYEGDVPEQSG
jgi:cytochrome c-type biogenesis protein CcmE